MVGRHYYILGAGITGLTIAYELLKKGCAVTLLEKEKSVGGLARTLIWHGVPIDLGPKIYHTPDRDIIEYWASEFKGLFHERLHYSKNYKEGTYYDYPLSYENINKFPEHLREKILKELKGRDAIAVKKATNYFEYIRAMAGPTLQAMFYEKYPKKVWGIDTKELDTNWAPKRVEIRRNTTPFYWRQWSAVGIEGSGSIVKKLRENILRLGGKILTDNRIKGLGVKDDRIDKIVLGKKVITLGNHDIVISTIPITELASALNEKSELKFRGSMVVYLYTERKDILPKGIDFIYIDDPDIPFHRVCDTSQFVKKASSGKNVYTFEVAYSAGGAQDKKLDKKIAEEVINKFALMGFMKKEDVLDCKVIRLPYVYPLLYVGYKKELSRIRSLIDRVANLYNIGSMAEYSYSDLQILFSKAIDLAYFLTDKTSSVNKTEKSMVRGKFMEEIKIASFRIGASNPAFIIAEIGLNHNGTIELAKKLIDKAVVSGANAVKLQSYDTSGRVSEHGKTSRYAEKILGLEETDYQMLKKNELSLSDTKKLFKYAKKKKILIFSTPFDEKNVRALESLGVDCYKISSFDLTNLPLVRAVARTKKPIILSTGMSNLSEIEEALQAVGSEGNDKVALLHCVSVYPSSASDMNIKAIETLRSAFKVSVGLSDHTIGWVIPLAAASRGANIIEKHFTLDKNMEGPDHALSLDPGEFKEMVKNIRTIEASLGDGIKRVLPGEFNTIMRFRKTIYASRRIKKGRHISAEDITLKGPAYGIYPKFTEVVLGQAAACDIEKDTPITWEKIKNV